MHEICKNCKWNNFPTCKGTIMSDGTEMLISSLKKGFECGQKLENNITDFSIKIKNKYDLKDDDHDSKIMNLEKRVTDLEKNKN